MVVADTGALLALVNRADGWHGAVKKAFDATRQRWVIPWVVLAELDYVMMTRLGERVARAFHNDLANGAYRAEAPLAVDVSRALALREVYRDLELGLVDSLVMAMAERVRATAIATTDARHFRAVTLELEPAPRLIPLDAL